jgi:acyl carrier protein
MEIQDEIRDYIVENMLFGDGQKLGADTSFQEGGILDSTGFLEVITFVEGRYGIRIADREMVPENFGTLHKITQFIKGKINEKTAA